MACNTFPARTSDGRELGWAGISYRSVDCQHPKTGAALFKGWYIDLTRASDTAMIVQGLSTREEADDALRAYLRKPYAPEVEEAAKRLHRLDPAGPLVGWDRLWESARERYRQQAREQLSDPA